MNEPLCKTCVNALYYPQCEDNLCRNHKDMVTLITNCRNYEPFGKATNDREEQTNIVDVFTINLYEILKVIRLIDHDAVRIVSYDMHKRFVYQDKYGQIKVIESYLKDAQ